MVIFKTLLIMQSVSKTRQIAWIFINILNFNGKIRLRRETLVCGVVVLEQRRRQLMALQ